MGKLYEILGLVQYEAEKISSSPRAVSYTHLTLPTNSLV